MNRLDQVHPIIIIHDDVNADGKLRRNETPQVAKDKDNNNKDTVRNPTHVVGFRTIQIREFDRIVGDHPDARDGGPPLSIGWTYHELDKMDLDDYENAKQQQQPAAAAAPTTTTTSSSTISGNSSSPPRIRRLTSGARRDILRMQFDISIEEIEEAEAEVKRIQKQREQTNKQRKVFAKTEEMMESAKRKLWRPFVHVTQHGVLVRGRNSLSGNTHYYPATMTSKRRNTTTGTIGDIKHLPIIPSRPVQQKPMMTREISV